MYEEDFKSQLEGLFSDFEAPEPQPESAVEKVSSKASQALPLEVKPVGAIAPTQQVRARVEPPLMAEVQTDRARIPPAQGLRTRQQPSARRVRRTGVAFGFLVIVVAACITLGTLGDSRLGSAMYLNSPSLDPSGWQFKEEWLGLVFIAVLVVAGLAMATVAWLQKKNLRKRLHLELRNLGNVPSGYELQAKDSDGALRFQFALDGGSLEQRQVFEASPVTTEAVTEQPPPSSDSTVDLESVRQTAGGAMRVSGAIADLLSSVGSVLPSSMRTPVWRMANQLRQGRSAVRRAEQLPRRVARTTSVAPTFKTKGKPEAAPISPKVVSSWLQTPLVEPGATLTIDLFIYPVKSRQDGFYPFQVFSRSVEQEEAPLVVEEGSLQIPEASRFRRYSPYLLILAIAAVVLFLAFLASRGVLG